MKSLGYIVIGTALIAAFAVGAYVGPNLPSPGAGWPPAETPAATPHKTFVGRPAAAAAHDSVVALGRIEPASRIIRVSGPGGTDGGRIAALVIAEGDRVTAGQTLAILDTEPRLRAALAKAEANLSVKKAQLAQKVMELANSERSLQASLDQYAAERDRAQWDLERLGRLNKAGVYSEPALIDKQLAVQSAAHRLETARLALDRIKARNEQGILLEEAVVRAELLAAESAVGQARADLDFAVIRAPIDGRVLRLLARTGQQIGSDGFAEMGNTDAMIVRAEVFESDAGLVVRGQSAIVTSRALDRPLRGVVERLGLAVGTQSVIREDPAAVLDARVVEVFIRLDDASSARVAGLTNLQVRVVIAAARRESQQVSHAP